MRAVSSGNGENIFTSIHVGIDDVDATIGGCTTHVAYLIVKKVLKEVPELVLIDYPNLVRLNPAVPFKTRGNGGVALRFRGPPEAADKLVELVANEVTKYVNSFPLRPSTDPGIAVLIGDVPDVLRRLHMKALTDYVHRDYVKNVVEGLGNSLRLPLGLSRGVVGALAAIGWPEGVDCTYELIAYRRQEQLGMPRCVDQESVRAMDEVMRGETFLNYDYSSGRDLITPEGPDPVLLGIRGESPEAVLKAFRMVKLCEPAAGYMIFRSNQGTDSHHIPTPLGMVRPYRAGCFKGRVSEGPKTLRGGAAMVRISDEDHSVWAAAFRESGLTGAVRGLMVGDVVEVCGIVRLWEGAGAVIHVEKLRVLEVIRYRFMNPRCPKCGARMKSAGRGKGWKCPKCGYRAKDLPPEKIELSRGIEEGLYLPPAKAFKHLMKPPERYGRERKCFYTAPAGEWLT